MVDKCKHFLKSFVEQICSDRSIKATAADYATFSTLSLLSGGRHTMRGAVKKVGAWGRKRHFCALWAGQLVIPTIIIIIIMLPVQQLLLTLQQQCRFWNHSSYFAHQHHRQLLLGCSSNVISQIENIQRFTSVSLMSGYFPYLGQTNNLRHYLSENFRI